MVQILRQSRETKGRRDRGGRNCTRSPLSTNPFEDNNLRITTLSPAASQQRDPGTDLHDLAAIDVRLARCASSKVTVLIIADQGHSSRVVTPCH